jgi:hypothetical protein
MGEGVEESLIDVAMQKGRLSEAQAKEFWARKREDGQYIAVSTPLHYACISYTDTNTGNMVKTPPPHTCKYSYDFYISPPHLLPPPLLPHRPGVSITKRSRLEMICVETSI